MSNNDPTEVFVAVHLDRPERAAVLVSEDGDNDHAKWVARTLLLSMHLTGKTTRGTDRTGKPVTLPMAHITVPEWLAKREGWI